MTVFDIRDASLGRFGRKTKRSVNQVSHENMARGLAVLDIVASTTDVAAAWLT